MRNKIPRISNEEVISAFSTGVSDIKMREKLSMNDELTSVVRLFEIADRCAKAKEGRLFVHNLPEALPPKLKSKDLKRKEAAVLAANQIISNTAGTAPNATRVVVAATAFSTRRTPTIPTIVGLSEGFMKKMVSPSAAGVAAATARVDPGAIAATMTARKVAAVRVCLEPIPSRCPHQQTIVGRRTRGAIKSRETSPLASWVDLRLHCLTDTSSSCRERSRRHSPTSATA
jgi:hypothetical protein